MQRALVIGLFAGGLVSGSAAILTLRERWQALRWITVSVATYLIGYILASAILLLPDRFSVEGTLFIQLAVNLLVLIIQTVRAVAKKRPLFGEIDWNVREYVIPIALALVALLLSANNFGFFGMGQDEGVYQTKAIDFMNGKTERVYHFEELDAMEDQEQKDRLLEYSWHALGGLYSLDSHWSRNETLQLPSVVNPDVTTEANTEGAVYHGIPTFPAILALFGILGGGYARMMDAQTVFYVLCVLMLWFVTENFGFKKGTSVFVCLVFLLSPQSIWLSKSSLTEMLLALILCMFLYLVTEPEHKERRWWSAFMVTAFACLHVSIYVMYPLFLGLYILLYLTSGERQYMLAGVVASISHLLGMTFMTVVSSFYVVMNLAPLARGPVTTGMAWYIVMAMGIVGLLISTAALCIKPFDRRKVRQALRSRAMNAVFRLVVVLLIAWSAVRIAQVFRNAGLSYALTTSSLYVFIWLTGLIVVPLAAIWLIRKGSRALDNLPVAVVSCMFIYMVLLMTAVFKPSVAYTYYYSRYVGPYIPIACLMAGVAVDRMSTRTVCACIAVSALAVLPFDWVLATVRDDTFCSFAALERVMTTTSGEDTAVLFSRADTELYREFFLPIKANGAHCFLQEDDTAKQLATLARDYDTLCFIGQNPSEAVPDDWLKVRLLEDVNMDDNISHRLPFCPLPLGFNSFMQEISIYRYDLIKDFSASVLATTGQKADDRIVLHQGELQYGPYVHLAPGSYEVEVLGEHLSGVVLSATSDVGAQEIPIRVLLQEEDRVVFQFSLETDADLVEFITLNVQEEPVYMDRIILNDVTYRE